MGLTGGQIKRNRLESGGVELPPRERMFKRNQRVRIPVRLKGVVPVSADLEMKLVLAVKPGLRAA